MKKELQPNTNKIKYILRILLLFSILPIISLVGLDDAIKLPTEYIMKENTILTSLTYGVFLNLTLILIMYIIGFIIYVFDN
jgi:hypothetical protein